jgi:signal transduction histidine kinase/ligand-binding sensor domain-containing protein
MKGNRLYILVGFLVVLATTLQASTGFYYKRVNFREGMASKVYSIYVDRNDMVWCGTKNGLVRFNDQSLKTYAHDNHKPFSIPFGVVSRVDADSRNRLWVITEQGVALHRSRTDDFVTLFKTKGKPLLAFDLCMVPDGVVFIAADGIYKYNNSSGKLRKVCRPLSPYSPATKLVKYDDNTLFYYGGQKGLVRIDCRTWKTQRMPLLGFKMMECVFVDSKKRIWISPEDIFEGMYCFDKEGRLLHSYPPINSPGGNVVTSVAERYGNIIICTEGNGCYAIDPFTHLVRIYNHVSGDNYYAPPSNSICSIFIDRSGGIWLGTTRQGLLNVRPVSMRTFYEVPFGNEHGLSNGTVLCLFEEAPDRIWVGTDGGGLDLFTPSDNTFKHFPSTFDEKIVSICNLSPGKLLLRAYVKGFYVFDTSTGISTPFVVTNQQSAVAVEKLGQSAELRCLDKENILMLGSTTDGIFNTRTSQIRMIDYKHHDGNVLHYIDNPYNGETFVHDATSIYHLNTLTCNLSLVCRLKGGGVSINTAACGSNGNFCIGTNRGLFIYYAKKGILIPKRTKLFNSVNVILIDMKDKMWVATTNRVFDWVRSKQRFMVFGETDGVLSNEYMPRVGLRASNGCFYFGCTNGLLAIDKSFQVKRINRGRLVLADLTVNGKATPEPLTQSIPQLEVKSNSNISLRVMNVEHDLFRQKVYRFYIKGFSGNYFESFSPTFELRGLPTGHYRILVSVMLGDGSWTPYQQVLDLSMVPPWYLDSWFVSVSISLLLIVLYIVSRRIMYNRSSRMKWEIDARERQVNNDKMNFLIDITHELRTPLTLIHAPLDRMLKTMPATNPLYDRLKAVLRQTTRMKHLINMVLDVHKMETSETRLRIQPNNLNSWLRQVTEDFANEGNAQGIALVYDFDEQVDIVSFDKDKCDMVIYNLLGNAMKHSSAGGHIYVCTRLTTDANHVRITISDEGPGLKGVDPAKLFQRFYQGG